MPSTTGILMGVEARAGTMIPVKASTSDSSILMWQTTTTKFAQAMNEGAR